MDDLFIELFKKYHNDVYRLAYGYTLNFQDAEDIMQQTFIKLYKNINKLKQDEEYTKKWLFKVASNQSKDLLKSFWKKKKTNCENFDVIFSNKQNLEKEDLIQALSKIDKKYRIPFYLHYYEGYNAKEIAKIMKLSESAVKSRLTRVKDKIKKEMEII